MKKSTAYILLTVIWALGTWAWTANVMSDAKSGTLNGFRIAAAVCSAICAALNFSIYFRMRKKEK